MTNRAPRIRFLPITIFAAALMLTVKIGDIWSGFDGLAEGGISVSEASAQQPEPTAQPAAKAPPAESEGEAGAAPKEDEETPASRMAAEDPTLLTQAEIDLLQQLAERREKLEAREEELELRAGMLEAAESRIDKKVADLKVLQQTIEKLMASYDQQREEKMRSLVKIYENMKPKDAARIFEELDMDTLLMVAERMKERKLAPIMASMDPSKAKEMTVQLTRAGELPESGSETGG